MNYQLVNPVKPGGLSFSGLIEDEEWELWIAKLKSISSDILGFKVVDPETGS